MNRRHMLKALGLAPVAAIPVAVDAASDPAAQPTAFVSPEPIYATIPLESGNRSADVATAFAMAFFHEVMIDDHVPLELRMEAAQSLVGAAQFLSENPLAGVLFENSGGY